MATSSYESLNYAKWDCKYHVAFLLKGQKTALYGKVRRFLGPVLREWAVQRGSTILAGPMVQDHVRGLIRIPLKYLVASLASNTTLLLLHFVGVSRLRNLYGYDRNPPSPIE